MPLFDKNRSLLDNASDVVEKHKKLIAIFYDSLYTVVDKEG